MSRQTSPADRIENGALDGEEADREPLAPLEFEDLDPSVFRRRVAETVAPAEIGGFQEFLREPRSPVEDEIDRVIDGVVPTAAGEPDWAEVHRIGAEARESEATAAPEASGPGAEEARREKLLASAELLFARGDTRSALRIFLEQDAYERLAPLGLTLVGERRYEEAYPWILLSGDREALGRLQAVLQQEIHAPQRPRTYEENEAIIALARRVTIVLTLDEDAFTAELDALRGG